MERGRKPLTDPPKPLSINFPLYHWLKKFHQFTRFLQRKNCIYFALLLLQLYDFLLMFWKLRQMFSYVALVLSNTEWIFLILKQSTSKNNIQNAQFCKKVFLSAISNFKKNMFIDRIDPGHKHIKCDIASA